MCTIVLSSPGNCGIHGRMRFFLRMMHGAPEQNATVIIVNRIRDVHTVIIQIEMCINIIKSNMHNECPSVVYRTRYGRYVNFVAGDGSPAVGLVAASPTYITEGCSSTI